MHLYTCYRAGLACSHTQSKQTHTRKVISGFITGNEEENVAGLRKKKRGHQTQEAVGSLALYFTTSFYLCDCLFGPSPNVPSVFSSDKYFMTCLFSCLHWSSHLQLTFTTFFLTLNRRFLERQSNTQTQFIPKGKAIKPRLNLQNLRHAP